MNRRIRFNWTPPWYWDWHEWDWHEWLFHTWTVSGRDFCIHGVVVLGFGLSVSTSLERV